VTVEWKILPSSQEAREKYKKDGTLKERDDNPAHLELRILLDEPLAQQTLGVYARQKKSLDIFMCWIDIQEYKNIPTEDYRRSKALHIYHKYVKAGAVLELGGLQEADRDMYLQAISNSKASNNNRTSYLGRSSSSGGGGGGGGEGGGDVVAAAAAAVAAAGGGAGSSVLSHARQPLSKELYDKVTHTHTHTHTYTNKYTRIRTHFTCIGTCTQAHTKHTRA